MQQTTPTNKSATDHLKSPKMTQLNYQKINKRYTPLLMSVNDIAYSQ